MKRLLLSMLVCLWAAPLLAAQQTVENGETMGQARTKINSNFTELYNFNATLPSIAWGTGLTDNANTISVTNPVTAEAFNGSGWNGDTEGLTRNDAYNFAADYNLASPSTLNFTTDTVITEAQLLANKFFGNQGAAGESDITLPAISYSIVRAILVSEAQIIEINPPSGEFLDYKGTPLAANYVIDSPATVGAKAIVTRMQNASGVWHWSFDEVRGTWANPGRVSDN